MVGDHKEHELALAVAEAAAPRLRSSGDEVLVFDGPGYSAEHKHVLSWIGADQGLYCSIHWNTGRGRYALPRPDYRSRAGRRFAAAIGDALEDLPEIESFRSDELYPSASVASDHGRKPHFDRPGAPDWSWWTRGWVCIDGLWEAPLACGVLVECGFLDAPSHAPLMTPQGVERVAAALAAGIRAGAAAS